MPICVFLLAFCVHSSKAQIGRYADSLQIKTYVTIEYDRYRPKKIDVKKVFCDYCNQNQKKHLKLLAWQLAYIERFDSKNVIQKGERRITLLIRMSKKDLIALKEEE